MGTGQIMPRTADNHERPGKGQRVDPTLPGSKTEPAQLPS